eukprot:CAMPEP_0113818784 /NCGR_PEP_ID=MMETSP0328-20130328/413_1 /TAXON_ID=39455 /ORGANISM="Alexandrium minutum" /LENGTH=194 /DNA_ID=CAMNT_0000786719 /DNA_START=63 /DNA_END=650 /DNA_ORIENTATION=+ /assembly_acc=CAM_ASM_000350
MAGAEELAGGGCLEALGLGACCGGVCNCLCCGDPEKTCEIAALGAPSKRWASPGVAKAAALAAAGRGMDQVAASASSKRVAPRHVARRLGASLAARAAALVVADLGRRRGLDGGTGVPHAADGASHVPRTADGAAHVSTAAADDGLPSRRVQVLMSTCRSVEVAASAAAVSGLMLRILDVEQPQPSQKSGSTGG